MALLRTILAISWGTEDFRDVVIWYANLPHKFVLIVIYSYFGLSAVCH
jgi:hypothetical protein